MSNKGASLGFEKLKFYTKVNTRLKNIKLRTILPTLVKPLAGCSPLVALMV